MSKGKGDAPDPPDYSSLAASSEKSAEMWSQVAREQLAWAKETDTANRATLERVLGVQLPQMEKAFQYAEEDRARYKDVFQPIEDNLVKEFQTYDTQAKREAEAAKRITDVRTAFDAQRTNATRSLEDYGIDPSQTRYQALDLGYRAQEAAASALAGNQGRKYVEETGRALRGEAINIGRGYPAQVAQSQGIVNQTAGGASANTAGMTNAGVNAFGSAVPFGQMGMGGYGQAANIRNMGYQNQLASYQANSANNAGFWGGLGSLAGQGMMAWGMKGAEGGSVPEDLNTGIPAPSDRIPALLSKDEYVVPADVVRKLGTMHFDKMLEKFKDGGSYDTEKQQAIPTGK